MDKRPVFEPHTISRLFHYIQFGRVSSSTSRVGGVRIVVSPRFRDFTRKYDLQLYKKCVWVEIPNQNHRSLLTGNHCFHPDT
jgi:hypothetical protein